MPLEKTGALPYHKSSKLLAQAKVQFSKNIGVNVCEKLNW